MLSGKLNLIIRVVGCAGNYFAFVFEFKGDQLLVKHKIAGGLPALAEAEKAGEAYKAQYPNFMWRE